MKRYSVTIMYHSSVEVDVIADSLENAIEMAKGMAEKEPYLEEMNENLCVFDTDAYERELNDEEWDGLATDLIAEELVRLTEGIIVDHSDRNQFINSIFGYVKDDFKETAEWRELNPEDVRVSLARVMLNLSTK